jgi:hypothetical protein
MTTQEIRELLDIIEAKNPDAKLRLDVELSQDLHRELRKKYLCVAEETAWGQWLAVSDKKDT